MSTKLDKVAAKTASEICARFELEQAGARALLTEQLSPGEFLDLLIRNEFFPDGVRFLSHALPPGIAVSWACGCAREPHAPERNPEQEKALQAAEEWVKNPGEKTARAAFAAAQAAQFSNPAGCAALAAFFGGSDIAPEGAPPVPPPPEVTPQIVTGSIVLSAVAVQPENAASHYRRFLELGIEAANGDSGYVPT